MDTRELGRLLKKVRDDSGLTLEYLAHKCQRSKGHMSLVESNDRTVMPGMVEVYARETGHTELHLLFQGITVDSVLGIVNERIKLRRIERAMEVS